MENKKTNITLIVVTIVVVIICFFATSGIKKDGNNTTSSNEETSADVIIQNAQNESAAISEDEMKDFTETSVDNYLNLYNATDKKRLVLVASPSCGYCQIAEPIIQNIAYKYNIKIYYLDSSAFSSEDQTKFIESDEAFASGFGTPMLLLVSDGKIHDSVDGLTDTEGYMEFFTNNGYISE